MVEGFLMAAALTVPAAQPVRTISNVRSYCTPLPPGTGTFLRRGRTINRQVHDGGTRCGKTQFRQSDTRRRTTDSSAPPHHRTGQKPVKKRGGE